MWAAVDEDHEIMVLGVEETTMQAHSAHDLLCSLLEVIAASTFGGSASRRVAASRSPPDGHEVLTAAYPKEVEDIEGACSA
jgi:hypothetical protein